MTKAAKIVKNRVYGIMTKYKALSFPKPIDTSMQVVLPYASEDDILKALRGHQRLLNLEAKKIKSAIQNVNAIKKLRKAKT